MPPRVKEKGSVRGTWPVSTIHCPVRRCHQRSGSVAVRAVIASKPKKRIPAKSRRLVASVVTGGRGNYRGSAERVLAPDQSMLGPMGGRDAWLGSFGLRSVAQKN